MSDRKYSISRILGENGIFSDGDWIESKDQDKNGEVRLIQLADIGDGQFLNKSKKFLTLGTAQRLKCTFLQKGDILIARMPDPLGRACIFPGSDQLCITSVDVSIVRLDNPLVVNKWLALRINSPYFRHSIKQYTVGTSRQRISRSNLDKIEFDLPSVNDQKRSVYLLDKLSELINDREFSIFQINYLVESTFYMMFGDVGINNNNFATDSLRQLTTKIGSGSTPTGGSQVYKHEGFLFIRSQNIKMYEIDFESVLFIDNEIHKKMKGTWVKREDVLLNITGASIGRVACYDKESDIANVNQHVCIIRTKKEKLNPYFLTYCIGQKNFNTKILGKNIGGTRQGFNFSQIGDFEIPLPKIESQAEFEVVFKAAYRAKAQMRDSLNHLIILRYGITELIFNGELNLTNVPMGEVSPYTLSAFEDKPELADAAMRSINYILRKEYDTLPDYSEDPEINNKLKQLVQERMVTSKLPLDIDLLKLIVTENFKTPFRASSLQKYLNDNGIEYEYDELVSMLFLLLKSKKSFLRQKNLSASETATKSANGLAADDSGSSGGIHLIHTN